MAFLAWIFMQHVFAAWIDPETAQKLHRRSHHPGRGALHGNGVCVAYLTDGDPAYTLVQVAVNDLIMLVAFAPIVMFLCGVAHVVVPAKVLITSVVVFIVIPLAAGWLTRTALLKSHGKEWFEQQFPAEVSSRHDRCVAADTGVDFRVSIQKPHESLGWRCC